MKQTSAFERISQTKLRQRHSRPQRTQSIPPDENRCRILHKACFAADLHSVYTARFSKTGQAFVAGFETGIIQVKYFYLLWFTCFMWHRIKLWTFNRYLSNEVFVLCRYAIFIMIYFFRFEMERPVNWKQHLDLSLQQECLWCVADSIQSMRISFMLPVPVELFLWAMCTIKSCPDLFLVDFVCLIVLVSGI